MTRTNIINIIKRSLIYLGFLILTVAVSIGVKLFVFDVFKVPTPSMASSISAGDHIVVNKTILGPRWPTSPLQISWFNLLAVGDQFRGWFLETNWSYKRWPIGRKVKRNDILVFEGPWENKPILVKRCKGLPGETVLLNKDSLFIDGVFQSEPPSVNYQYFLKNIDRNTLFLNDQKLPVTEMFMPSGLKKVLHLHPELTSKLRDQYDSIGLSINLKPNEDSLYGPIKIPEKKEVIDITEFKKYQDMYVHLINTFENAKAEIKEDTLYINGNRDSLFQFNHNYYFMMGDNRNGSEDSRKWGLIPEENIIGVVSEIRF